MKDIANITLTRYLLDHYHISIRKQYGQNFIIDRNIIDKIIRIVPVDETCAVIEIGPGLGAMTQILSRHAGFVQAYEIDESFLPIYHQYLNLDNTEIRIEDFLKVDLRTVVADLRSRFDQVLLFSNLPYYLTTDMIEKIITADANLDVMILMVQEEVARKLCGDQKSPLKLMLEDVGDIAYEFSVSRNVFYPQPHVDSAIIKYTFLHPFDSELYQLLKDAFRQRRKTIYNNLKQYPHIEEILTDCHLSFQERSEHLSLKDFKMIAEQIKKYQRSC